MTDLLSAAERDAIAAPLLRDRLQPLGLYEIAARRWIDGSKPPARRLFELKLVKGAAMKACWGFSLDFVPHFAGGDLRWHRSDKAAMLDVIIDTSTMSGASFLDGADRLRTDLQTLLPQAVAAARRDWDRGSTYAGMLALVEEICGKRTNCFGFFNYTQLPLAYAFLAAKVGNLKLAQQALDEYVTEIPLDEDGVAKLRQLLRKCAEP